MIKQTLKEPINCWACGDEVTEVITWPGDEFSNNISKNLCESCDRELYEDFIMGGDVQTSILPKGGPVGPKSTTVGKPTVVTPKKCGIAHLFTVTWGEGKGNLILASSRNGRLADGVDMGLFFDKTWKNIAGKSPVELIEGSNGQVGPDLFADNGYATPPFIMLDWKDMDPPPRVAFDYAKWAHERITEHAETIQVGCIGGHGRTGTFAAMVMIVSDMNRSAMDAIDWVHDKYCVDAIESARQEDAIFEFWDWVHGEEVKEGTSESS